MKQRMRKNLNRVCSILLAAVMVLSIMPVSALAAEDRSGEYTIDELYMYDHRSPYYDQYTSIPQDEFGLMVSVSNNGTRKPERVAIVFYGFDGQMLDMQQIDIGRIYNSGSASVETVIDNRDGRIGCIKAFVVPKDGPMIPLAGAMAIEEKLPTGAIGGVTLSVDDMGDESLSVAVTADSDCLLEVEVTNEDTGRVLLQEEHKVTAEDTEIAFAGLNLPEYFIVTARLVHANGMAVSDPYTCLDYTRSFEAFSAKTEDDYAPDRVVDIADEDDGNFIVLAEDVLRLSQTPIDETEGSYTFAAGDDLQGLKTGDKISFRSGEDTYMTIRIGSITSDGHAVTITEDSSAKIADLYEAIKINTSIVAQPSARTGEATYRFARAAAPAAEKSDAPKVFSGIELGSAISSNVHTSFGSLEAQMRAGGQVVAYYDPTIWGDDYLRVDLLSKVVVEGDLTVGPTAYVKEEILLFPEVSLAGLEIIGHIPLKLTGGFEVECQAGMNMHISAEVAAGYTFNTRDGIQKHTYKAITPSSISAQGSAEIEIGVRFSVGVALLNDLIEASVGVGYGIGVEGTVVAATAPGPYASEYHACDLCMDGRSYAYLNANINMHYEVSEKIEGDLFNIELIRAEWTIGQFYLSLLNDADSIHEGRIAFDWGECPNIKYLVTFVTYNYGYQENGWPVTVYNKDGQVAESGISPFKPYLYPDSYVVKATVETNEVEKDIVVMNSLFVRLEAMDAILSGTVTDGETNAPLSGVRINILKEDVIEESITTYAGGSYEIQLPGGPYKIAFVLEGYESKVVSLPNLQGNYTLNAALMPISEPGVLTGRITDQENGNGIAQAMITAVQEGGEPVYAQTDSMGYYSMELAEGSYDLTFGHKDYKTASDWAKVVSKETTTANAALEKTHFTLTVRAANQKTGEAVPGIRTDIYSGGEWIAANYANGDGSCTFTLPNGEYTLRLTANNYKVAEQAVTIDGAGVEVNVPMVGLLASGYCGEGREDYKVVWELAEDGVMTIYGEGGIEGANSSTLERDYNAYADQIREIIIEEGITHIGKNAFQYLPNLRLVRLPDSCTTIAEGVFAVCHNLQTIKLPETLTTIGKAAFAYSGLRSIDLPDSLTKMDKEVFFHCVDLLAARLPNGIKEIPERTFEGCTSLVTVDLPTELTHILDYAFYDCDALARINLPDTLIVIWNDAFASCDSLQEIHIPASILGIHENAFRSCVSLETVYIDPMSELTTINRGAFENCDRLKVLYLPAALELIESYAVNQKSDWDNRILPSTIERVYYGGSEAQWDEIDIYFPWAASGTSGTAILSAKEYFSRGDTIVTFNWKG